MKKTLFSIIFFFTLIISSAQPAALDTSFDPGSGAAGVGPVSAICVQSDGKILMCGNFVEYDGVAIKYIARANSDGSIDPTFHPGTSANGVIYEMALQPDGKILIAGNFTSYAGTPANYLARLNSDGTFDTSFDTGTGPNYVVKSICVQPDGKILIGGNFGEVDGITQNYLARLNSDGSLDPSFAIGAGPSSWVNDVVLQDDGKIIITGHFNNYDGLARLRIARINSDGSIDPLFNPGAGPNNYVDRCLIQADGKLVINGEFTAVAGSPCNYLARLNSDGSLDLGFNMGVGPQDNVWATAIDSDGKILIGGQFTSYNGIARNRIARLNSDGTLDGYFDPQEGASSQVNVIAIQPNDEHILIGGYFAFYAGEQRLHIARLIKCNSKNEAYFLGCDSYTVPSGGETYTASGTYADTIPNFFGCDSLLTIYVTLNYTNATAFNATGCNQFVVPSGDETYTIAGVYTDTIPTMGGCDSVLTISVTLGEAYTDVFKTGLTLHAAANGVSYQWVECPSMTAVSGATGKDFTPDEYGNYAVIITDDFCVDTSQCYFVSDVGLEDKEPITFTVSPNPFSENITIYYMPFNSGADVILTNLTGELIYQSTIVEEMFDVELRDLPNGVYFLLLKSENYSETIKIIKQ